MRAGRAVVQSARLAHDVDIRTLAAVVIVGGLAVYKFVIADSASEDRSSSNAETARSMCGMMISRERRVMIAEKRYDAGPHKFEKPLLLSPSREAERMTGVEPVHLIQV